ncbi:MAG: choice-of-anchor D domain-containing protein [Planctomycetes bacterium]|nr:choice-of-anchor D domain-containing protein [Planctomycetota bacterium]
MKYLAVLAFIFGSFAAAQTVNLVDLQQPPGGPVLPGTTGLEVLQFRVYKNAGSGASNMTQVKVSLNVSTNNDWASAYLYYDVDGSRTVTGGDQILDNTSIASGGVITFNGFSQVIQDSFYNGRDYLVVIDVEAQGTATPGNTISMDIDAPDLTVSAGTVTAPLGAISSNIHTIRLDPGCEIDVERNATAIPSSSTLNHDIGYIPTSGGNVTFDILNTGSGALQLTGTPTIEFLNPNNCTAAQTGTPPSTSVASMGSTSFTVAVDPNLQTAFSFVIHIESDDFDEGVYVIQVIGSAVPYPEISIEYNSAVVDDGDSISLGSYTAGIAQTLNFTIKNTGPAALNLSGTPIVDFPTQQNVNCTLATPPTTPVAANTGSTTFTVSFTPAGSGNWIFSIWVESNDQDENPYNITLDGSSPAVTPTRLGVYRDPDNANATLAFGTQPIVSVQDANGAVDNSNNTTVIVASITTGTGATGASLGGTVTATCVNGYATFSSLSIDMEATGYTLTFTDQASTLTSAVSGSFDVGPAPPAPKKDSGNDGGGCSTGLPGTPWMLLCAALALLALAGRLTFKKI